MSEQAQSAPVTETPAQPQQEAPKTPVTQEELHELNINGKQKKVGKDELYKLAQLGGSASEKFESAAKQKKEVEKIIARAKTDPIGALTDPELGLTEDQIREAFEKWYSKKYIEPETLTPEQRRLKELEEKNSKWEESEKKQKEELAKAEEEKLTAFEREKLQKDIVSAIDANGLKKTPFVVSRLAFYTNANLKNGWDAPMDLIVQKVKEESDAIASDFLDEDNIDMFIKRYGDRGEAFVKRVNKYYLEKLRATRGVKVDTNQPPEQISGGRKTMRDVDRALREMRTGRRT